MLVPQWLEFILLVLAIIMWSNKCSLHDQIPKDQILILGNLVMYILVFLALRTNLICFFFVFKSDLVQIWDWLSVLSFCKGWNLIRSFRQCLSTSVAIVMTWPSAQCQQLRAWNIRFFLGTCPSWNICAVLICISNEGSFTHSLLNTYDKPHVSVNKLRKWQYCTCLWC